MSQRHSPDLTAARRAAELDTLADREVDVLVVGGGFTGAGVALDAASRGLSVALVEKADLAHGTSRWSSKLAHGGLRYLAHGDFGVAWESAAERAILADSTAPHLIRALPQLIPLTDAVSRTDERLVMFGLRLADGMRRAAGTTNDRLPRARRIPAAEVMRWAPALDRSGLRGGLIHWDGQLEDDARLVTALARTAASYGAKILTRVEVTRLDAHGADAVDVLTGSALRLRARHVVNATGVWAGTLAGDVGLRPSRGSHLLLDAARLGDPAAAVTVAVPGAKGRYVFALPRPDGTVLCGLTDDEVKGAIPDVPTPTAEDERFLLETLSSALERPLTQDDVIGRFAGLRPLLDNGEGATADVSRRHAVLENDGVLTVVGGKLTTYRRMAQDAVDVIAARPGVAAGPCRTHRLPVVGATAPGTPGRLSRRYGSEADRVSACARDERELAPLAPGVPYCMAELRFAVAAEGALDAGDVLDRRTRIGLVPAWREAALPFAEQALLEPAPTRDNSGAFS